MLFLLDIIDSNPYRFIKLYLKLVRKYLTRQNIKIEDHIRYRFAVWLLTVEDYLELKFRYTNESEEPIPVIKHTIDKRGNFSRHISWIKRKVYFPEEHRTRIETLHNLRNNLIFDYNDISSCFY